MLLFSPLSQAASTLLRALKQVRLREYRQSAATSFDARWKPSCSAVLARVNHWRHRLQRQPGATTGPCDSYGVQDWRCRGPCHVTDQVPLHQAGRHPVPKPAGGRAPISSAGQSAKAPLRSTPHLSHCLPASCSFCGHSIRGGAPDLHPPKQASQTRSHHRPPSALTALLTRPAVHPLRSHQCEHPGSSCKLRHRPESSTARAMSAPGPQVLARRSNGVSQAAEGKVFLPRVLSPAALADSLQGKASSGEASGSRPPRAKGSGDRNTDSTKARVSPRRSCASRLTPITRTRAGRSLRDARSPGFTMKARSS